ncbi:protein ORF46 [Anguillid herpesvirus 1]|uniref:Protein ORF46 n=1 Tax=Anguillid herpesvirus 1 TaxID=150286 RepID=A0A1J0REA3_9VIRU|nr:protein ORF46 [Anguillid herpesvirus 1]ADA57809.1 protein ORF46 [Anguillid herpesvirus 1]APD76209.1 ORF46 [Anguillid herpesvirus 1]QRM16339.1 protein ORF46 [Anguillid herpesvirus 1]QRM16598.1 protein ORF46 [Anguillid herpesvirus 1]QRM16862.1 protein ORF46 [Anguillid herpesvirus 1]
MAKRLDAWREEIDRAVLSPIDFALRPQNGVPVVFYLISKSRRELNNRLTALWDTAPSGDLCTVDKRELLGLFYDLYGIVPPPASPLLSEETHAYIDRKGLREGDKIWSNSALRDPIQREILTNLEANGWCKYIYPHAVALISSLYKIVEEEHGTHLFNVLGADWAKKKLTKFDKVLGPVWQKTLFSHTNPVTPKESGAQLLEWIIKSDLT